MSRKLWFLQQKRPDNRNISLCLLRLIIPFHKSKPQQLTFDCDDASPLIWFKHFSCQWTGHISTSILVNKRKIKQLGYVASPGTHVLWQAMNMLLRDSAEYLNESKVGCMMDLRPISEINGEYLSPRVINTHYRLDVLPQEFRRSRTVLGTCHMVWISSVIKVFKTEQV